MPQDFGGDVSIAPDKTRLGTMSETSEEGEADEVGVLGEIVVELKPVDMKGVLGSADPAQRLLRKQALIGQVVNGQDGRDLARVPGEVGRDQGRLPVIGVDQVGCPIFVQSACGELGRGGGKPSEAHVIVGPVAAVGVAIGVARPII